LNARGHATHRVGHIGVVNAIAIDPATGDAWAQRIRATTGQPWDTKRVSTRYARTTFNLPLVSRKLTPEILSKLPGQVLQA